MKVFELCEGGDFFDLALSEDDGFVVVLGNQTLDVKGEFVIEWWLGILGQDTAVHFRGITFVHVLDEIESDVVDQAGGESSVGYESDFGFFGLGIKFQGLHGDIGVSAKVNHIGDGFNRDFCDLGVHPIGHTRNDDIRFVEESSQRIWVQGVNLGGGADIFAGESVDACGGLFGLFEAHVAHDDLGIFGEFSEIVGGSCALHSGAEDGVSVLHKVVFLEGAPLHAKGCGRLTFVTAVGYLPG